MPQYYFLYEHISRSFYLLIFFTLLHDLKYSLDFIKKIKFKYSLITYSIYTPENPSNKFYKDLYSVAIISIY